MGIPLRPSVCVLALVTVAAAAMLLGPAGSGAAPARHCASFRSQAAAQAYFVRVGGRPAKDAERLDGDHDGVACEGRRGPYQGFAGFGYNARRNFFYGHAQMPAGARARNRFACLYGNRRSPRGPRRLNVYKIKPGLDKPLLDRRFGDATEADPQTGHLVWRIDAKRVKGRYYMAFEERRPLRAHRRNQCPAFRSRAITLPAPVRR